MPSKPFPNLFRPSKPLILLYGCTYMQVTSRMIYQLVLLYLFDSYPWISGNCGSGRRAGIIATLPSQQDDGGVATPAGPTPKAVLGEGMVIRKCPVHSGSDAKLATSAGAELTWPCTSSRQAPLQLIIALYLSLLTCPISQSLPEKGLENPDITSVMLLYIIDSYLKFGFSVGIFKM